MMHEIPTQNRMGIWECFLVRRLVRIYFIHDHQFRSVLIVTSFCSSKDPFYDEQNDVVEYVY
jgi:hypothetical protein